MEAFDLSTVFAMRAAERLVGVLIGGISIYLGFRLFLALPNLSMDGEGKVELPGGISIYVSRVGPGVFFALFGTILVGFSFINVISWDRDESAGLTTTQVQVAEIVRSESFSYVSGNLGDTSVSLEREALVRDLRTLRKLELALGGHVGGDEFVLGVSDTASALIAFPRVKRMMLHSVWDEQWGDYKLFADWVRDGARSPPPGDLAAIITDPFRQGN